jgi:hypothetical protein
MQLKSFRITNFRSVDDSGIIETDPVTALIGVNESGKSNLILPLWKLRPAEGGEIKPTADYPRKAYGDFREKTGETVFADATFLADAETRKALAAASGSPEDVFSEIRIRRLYDGMYRVTFPLATSRPTANTAEVTAILERAASELAALTSLKSEEDFANAIRADVATALKGIPQIGQIDSKSLSSILQNLPERESTLKTSAIGPRYSQLREALTSLKDAIDKPLPGEMKEVRTLALSRAPHFVYYTNYGNLDSEIYLPHVLANMERDDLGPKEEAKVRTLKVLFEFVGLEPQEILELGQDFKTPADGREPTPEEVAVIAEKKKERSILLQSAGTKLTNEFRTWWKQGDYRFRFEADGNHFRIWVSDDKRPEEVELEGRSTGLQWFLSFYLVFLVESKDSHAGSILLLDEPGMSLHPLAQRDLSLFFESLAKQNQIIYTTHSPFLIDADHFDRARKVYVAQDGTTKATSDLKATDGSKAERASGYAVWAALGLTVAESLLLGCTTIVVEGLSDQIYLSAIKTLLIAAGKITPDRELIFPPAGGAKGVKAVAALLSGRDEQLPFALFDNDSVGDSVTRDLRQHLYVDAKDRVLQVGEFLPEFAENAEIEDLLPPNFLIIAIDKWMRSVEYSFEESYRAGSPIVPQIEAWAKQEKQTLSAPAWKVELAKRVKPLLLTKGFTKIDDEMLERWTTLFKRLLA